MRLQPSKKPRHDPAALIASQSTPVLGVRGNTVALVRRDHLYAFLAQLLVQLVAVAGFVANQIVRSGFDQLTTDGQLHQRYFMMIRGMRALRQRQSMAIDNCHDFLAFSTFCWSDFRASALGGRKRGINVASRFVIRVFVAKLVSPIAQHVAQNVIFAPVFNIHSAVSSTHMILP